MSIFISSSDIPIGYQRPSFPSLYLPHNEFDGSSFLYYSSDVWVFTVYWSLILFGAVYSASGLISAFNSLLSHYRHHHKLSKMTVLENICVVVLFSVSGLAQGFCSGAIIGLLIQAIYKAGSLNMSTWIPFCWAIVSVLYDVCVSYSTSSVLL